MGGVGVVQISCVGLCDNYVLRLNHVQSNSLTHHSVFGGLSFWRSLNSKLTPSSTRSLKAWQNEWSMKWSMPPMTKRIWTLPARKLTIVFQGETEAMCFFPNDQANASSKNTLKKKIQNKMTRWIKMGQIFPNIFFRFLKLPPIWENLTGIFGQIYVPCNLWGLDAEGQPMKPSKDPLFSCVKPDQETISTVKERWTCPFLELLFSLNSSERSEISECE